MKNATRIKNTLRKFTAAFISDGSGQDLIEYVLIVALIAFAATAGMSTVASHINTAFTNVGTKLDAYVK